MFTMESFFILKTSDRFCIFNVVGGTVIRCFEFSFDPDKILRNF